MDYGAKGDGATDDAPAIQAAINAAMLGANGGNVIFPSPSRYLINNPLVVRTGHVNGAKASGITLLGFGGPGATMGGAGTGVGPMVVGGLSGTIKSYSTVGATIMPGPSWNASGFSDSAAILIDNTGGSVSRCSVQHLNVCGDLASNAYVNGIEFYGGVSACMVRDFAVYALYHSNSNGVYLAPDGSGAGSGGCTVKNGIVQFVGGTGMNLIIHDGTVESVHTQSVGSYGFRFTGRGGNTRVLNCRADLSQAHDGFYVEVSCGDYMGMIQFDNCSTQRNRQNGIHIQNSKANQEVAPVYLSNCVFQGDGTDGGSSGIRLAGQVTVGMTNTSVHVNHNAERDGNSYPANGITVTANGTGAAQYVSCVGGLITGSSRPRNIINAPATAIADYAYATISGQWGTGTPVTRQQGSAL